MSSSFQANCFYLSEKMHESKKDFLAFIEYFHLPISDEYEQLQFLIQTKKDIQTWIELWNGDFDIQGVVQATKQFREWKINEMLHNCSVDDFADLLYLDRQDFVETFFQQRSDKRCLEKLNEFLKDHSIREFFDFHIAQPTIRIEYLINSNCQTI